MIEAHACEIDRHAQEDAEYMNLCMHMFGTIDAPAFSDREGIKLMKFSNYGQVTAETDDKKYTVTITGNHGRNYVVTVREKGDIVLEFTDDVTFNGGISESILWIDVNDKTTAFGVMSHKEDEVDSSMIVGVENAMRLAIRKNFSIIHPEITLCRKR